MYFACPKALGFPTDVYGVLEEQFLSWIWVNYLELHCKAIFVLSSKQIFAGRLGVLTVGILGHPLFHDPVHEF